MDRQSHHGGTGTWRKGQWRSVKGILVPCRNGIHYCGPDQLVRWLGPTLWLFEDGTPDETLVGGDKLVTRKGRIVGRVETWNETTARLFAADCAEAALRFIPKTQREPSVAAIDAARRVRQGRDRRQGTGRREDYRVDCRGSRRRVCCRGRRVCYRGRRVCYRGRREGCRGGCRVGCRGGRSEGCRGGRSGSFADGSSIRVPRRDADVRAGAGLAA